MYKVKTVNSPEISDGLHFECSRILLALVRQYLLDSADLHHGKLRSNVSYKTKHYLKTYTINLLLNDRQ